MRPLLDYGTTVCLLKNVPSCQLIHQTSRLSTVSIGLLLLECHGAGVQEVSSFKRGFFPLGKSIEGT